MSDTLSRALRSCTHAHRLRGFLQNGTAVTIAVVAYGVLNAVLYASLVPLWEGFDEPYHYGYVCQLSRRHALPELGRTLLPADVWISLRLAPASHVVKQNLPFVTTFADFFRLACAERHAARARLDHLPVAPGEVRRGLNYEAHQAPLAYLPLAAADGLLSSAHLITRVWILRLCCGVLSAVCTAVFLLRLANRLQLPPAFHGPLLLAALSSQMFYAATAHVANDWLAIPLMIVLAERLVALSEHPTQRNAALLAMVLAAGLLTKAYFLALLPWVLAVLGGLVAKRRLTWSGFLLFLGVLIAGSGPWYVRNLLVSRSLSGMQETTGGVDPSGLVTVLAQIPWMRSTRQLVYASLWTENNSFSSFAKTTLSLLLAGLTAAAILYVIDCLRRRSLPLREGVLLGAVVSYGAGLVYSTAVSFRFTHGSAISTSPWYTQPIIPIIFLFLFLGVARFGRIGKCAGAWIMWCSTYIIIATYWVKLIPAYGGYSQSKSVLRSIIGWYWGNISTISDTLSTTAMVPGDLVLALAVLVTATALCLGVAFSANPLRPDRGPKIP